MGPPRATAAGFGAAGPVWIVSHAAHSAARGVRSGAERPREGVAGVRGNTPSKRGQLTWPTTS